MFIIRKVELPGTKVNWLTILSTLLYLFSSLSSLQAATLYSKANGNWNDTSTWGTSCGAGIGNIPGIGDDVIICEGYTIGITSNASCSKITIDTNGILNFNTSDTLIITSSTLIDGTFNFSSGCIKAEYTFSINGTMNMSSGNLTLTENVSNANLNINGVFNLSGGEVNVAHFTHIQNGGTFNISGTAFFTGEGDVKMRYIKGTINLSGGTALFKGELNSANAADEFNQTAGNIQFEGDFSWYNAGVFNAIEGVVVFKGNTTLNNVGSTGVWNFYDLIIEVDNSFNQFDVSTINVSGDWTNNGGSFTNKNREVVFNGKEAQNIGGSSPTNFYSLCVNNSSSTGLTLKQPTTISNLLKLTDGYVYTDSTNLIIIENNASATSGSNISFVSGPMKKRGNDPFVFPIGSTKDSIIWARLELVDDDHFRYFNASTEFTCTYHKDAAPNNSSEYLEASINHVSYVEYWDLERTYDIANNAQCNVRIYWEDSSYSGITDTSYLTLAHYNTDYSYYENLNGTPSGSGTGSIVSTVFLTKFSPITFGSTRGGNINPLPIELLSFDAIIQEQSVQLLWETASEVNNDFFTIEKSLDGVNFKILENVNGAGYSTSINHYSIVDSNPFDGISYYRLKQTDRDGQHAYSEIEFVQRDGEDGFSFSVYPNPSANKGFHLLINAKKNEPLFLEIHDLMGELVYVQQINISESFMKVFINDFIGNDKNGLFLISLRSESHKMKNTLYLKN